MRSVFYHALVTGIAERKTTPSQVILYPNYPNPFNPTTRIPYYHPDGGPVTIRVYNILGQEIRTLVHAVRPAGDHHVTWDGNDRLGRAVSSGMYLIRLESGGRSMVRKALLIR